MRMILADLAVRSNIIMIYPDLSSLSCVTSVHSSFDLDWLLAWKSFSFGSHGQVCIFKMNFVHDLCSGK